MSVDETITADTDQGINDAGPGRRRRLPVPSTRLALGCLILVAVGFAGGVLEAKHTGVTSTSNASTAARVPTAAARTGAAGATGATGTGGSTFGTVKLVDGSTIYLTTSDGSVVKVSTTGATKLQVSATGKSTELKAGSTIVVTGTADASGNIRATAVTQSASTGSAGTAGAPVAAASGAPGGAPGAAPASGTPTG